ncbi:GerMN domain-containing protein [Desulfospira joergensenii]|uniref:GerMN domain-containing protein n=1 Tax=Desulfospira joergensenii TaxID=53329 RepID=UPI0003B55AC3|nr:GerMN domain-containing protein [Desulfospira joergensenii]
MKKWMVILLAACLSGFFPAHPVRVLAEDPPGAEDDGRQLFEGFLYFTDREGSHLKAWPRQFPAGLESHDLGMKILGSLMAGPMDPDLESAWPEDTAIRAFFIADDGRAWVDLAMEDQRSGKMENTDTLSELLAVYSVVNSLTLNIPRVRQVKILVNGSDVASLGGHVSLEYFFKTNMLIVK